MREPSKQEINMTYFLLGHMAGTMSLVIELLEQGKSEAALKAAKKGNDYFMANINKSTGMSKKDEKIDTVQ